MENHAPTMSAVEALCLYINGILILKPTHYLRVRALNFAIVGICAYLASVKYYWTSALLVYDLLLITSVRTTGQENQHLTLSSTKVQAGVSIISMIAMTYALEMFAYSAISGRETYTEYFEDATAPAGLFIMVANAILLIFDSYKVMFGSIVPSNGAFTTPKFVANVTPVSYSFGPAGKWELRGDGVADFNGRWHFSLRTAISLIAWMPFHCYHGNWSYAKAKFLTGMWVLVIAAAGTAPTPAYTTFSSRMFWFMLIIACAVGFANFVSVKLDIGSAGWAPTVAAVFAGIFLTNLVHGRVKPLDQDDSEPPKADAAVISALDKPIEQDLP